MTLGISARSSFADGGACFWSRGPTAVAGRVWNYCPDRVFEWTGFRFVRLRLIVFSINNVHLFWPGTSLSQVGGVPNTSPGLRIGASVCVFDRDGSSMTLPSSVLYDDDDLQIVCLEGRGPDILVITFSSLGMFKPGGMTLADGHVFWGRQFIEKSGMSAIGFVAKRPHWFMTQGMLGAINAAKVITARYRHVVSYGSSMGGFAALKHSLALGCTSAIACGPQSTLEREALPALDHRYLRRIP